MASNVEISSSGYDVQVVDVYPPQLNCGICMFIMKNAMHGCTKHVFCEGCIMKYIECGIRTDGNITCPGGCGKIINPNKIEANEFADRMINCLTTKCSNEGCNWQGDLLDLVQVHQLNCEYILQSCVNNGCNEKLLKKDLLHHNEVCLYKLIECDYCHTDIIRINKEKHDVECFNEKVKCIYYDIGCRNDLCRRDICSHEQTHQTEHTKLIFLNLIICKNELLISNDEIKVLKQEIVVLKKDNSVSNEKLKEVEILKNDTLRLKQQIETISTELQELKNENSQLKEKSQNIDMCASSGIAVVKHEPVRMQLTKEVNNIACLKVKLRNARTLNGKVSLVNDDKVMIIKSNIHHEGFSSGDLSTCYKENCFQYLFDRFDLDDEIGLMMELLNNLKYHLYDYKVIGGQCYWFVFPLNLRDIKDIEVVVPDIFKIEIVNNELMVEILNQNITLSYVHIEKYRITFKHRQKINLQQLDDSGRIADPFAPGHGFLSFFFAYN